MYRHEKGALFLVSSYLGSVLIISPLLAWRIPHGFVCFLSLSPSRLSLVNQELLAIPVCLSVWMCLLESAFFFFFFKYILLHAWVQDVCDTHGGQSVRVTLSPDTQDLSHLSRHWRMGRTVHLLVPICLHFHGHKGFVCHRAVERTVTGLWTAN